MAIWGEAKAVVRGNWWRLVRRLADKADDNEIAPRASSIKRSLANDLAAQRATLGYWSAERLDPGCCNRQCHQLRSCSRSQCMARPRSVAVYDRRQAPSARYPEARQRLPQNPSRARRASGNACTQSKQYTHRTLASRVTFSRHPSQRGDRRARKQARPYRLGSSP